MATNVSVAKQSGAGKPVVKDKQSSLEMNGAQAASVEPGELAEQASPQMARQMSQQVAQQMSGPLSEFASESQDKVQSPSQSSSEQSVTALVADNTDTRPPSAQVDSAEAHGNTLGKTDVNTADVQHVIDESAAAGALLTSGGTSAAGLSTGALLGIGAGVVGVGAALGGGGGSSSAGATPSGVTDPTPTPTPTPTPVSSGIPTVKLSSASNSGADSDLITNDSTPTIEGTGTAGETITVTLSTGDTLSTTVAADGTWSVTPAAALADGMVTFSVVEQATGATASLPVALAVTIDTSVAAGVVGVIGGDGVVNHSEAAGVALSGTGAEAGASVSALISDGAGHDKTVTGTVGGDGQWSIASGDLSGLADGSYTVAATVTDTAGNHAVANGSFVLDTTGPAVPGTPHLAVGSDSGVSASDGITNVTLPYFLVDAPAAGETLSLFIDGNAVAASFDSKLGAMVPTDAIADGVHSVTYHLTDANGNSTSSAAASVTIDTVQAKPAAADMTDATDTGLSNTDNITGNASPAFATAALAAGETAELFIDGGPAVADATYDAATHTFTMNSAIADGSHFATYWVHDAAGNTSVPSDGLSFTIQSAAPTQTVAITSLTDDQGAVTGTLSTGALSDDTAPALTGTLSAGMTAGEHLQVFRDDGTGSVLLGDASVSGTDWTYADTGLVSGTTYSYAAQVTDAFGQHGTTSPAFSLTENSASTAGGSGVDTLHGSDAGSNNLWGNAGADVLIGGAGSDYARYDTSASSVVANLANPLLNTGDAAGDSYTSIEGLVGSDASGADDTLTGDTGNNDIRGLRGNDTISGGAGDDYIIGGAGSDTMTGGSGNDTFVFFPKADVSSGNAPGDADVIADFHSDGAGNDMDVITLRGVTSFTAQANGSFRYYEALTATGEVDISAGPSGSDLVLNFHDVTANTDSTVTLTGRAALYNTDSWGTIGDLITNNQLVALPS